MSERPGVLTFSPVVHRNLANAAADMVTKNKTANLQATLAARNAARSASSGNKENSPVSSGPASDSSSLMRAPKSAEMILLNMKKEVDHARGFLREVSAGRAGNDGPYFSPCRAKGTGEEKSIKNHPIYLAHVSPDEEYEMLLSSAALKKTRQEPAKEAALQRTINLKLRQAAQELLNKRNALAEKLCKVDDSFGDKEKSYKAQMQTFMHQIKREQASRVRAEGQADSYKNAAETQIAHLQAIAVERDNLAVRLQQAQEELNGRAVMEKDAHAQIGALAGSLNQDLCSMVEQVRQALEETMHGLQEMQTRESEARKQLQDLNVKYDEDVSLLRMQMEEMGEAREEEFQRTEIQIRELHEQLQAQADNKDAQIAELQSKRDEQSLLLEEKESELKDMAVQIQDQSTQLRDMATQLQDTLTQLQCTGAELESKTSELACMRDDSNAVQAELRGELEMKTLDAARHIEQISDLAATNQQLQEQVQQSAEAFAASAAAAEEEIAHKIAELDSTAAILTERSELLNEARTELAQKNLALEEAQAAHHQLQMLHDRLQESHAQLNRSSSELQENFVQVQKSFAQVQHERDDLQAMLQTNREALEEEKSQHATTSERECALREALEAKSSELTQLEAQAAVANSQHEMERSDLEAQIVKLQDYIAALKQEGGSASATAERHAATITDLQGSLQAKVDECKELQADVLRRKEREERLQLDMQREVASNQSLQAKVEALEEKAGDMREKLAVSQAQLSSSEEDVKRRQEREEKRDAELSCLKAQLQDITHARDLLIAERERIAANHAADCQRAAQERDELLSKLAAGDSSVAQLRAQVTGLEDEVRIKIESISSSTALLQEKEAQVCAMKEALQEQERLRATSDHDSKLALEERNKECQVAAAAVKALEGEKKEHLWKLETQAEKVADLKAQITAANAQLEERRKDLDKREGEKEEARMEVARLKAERDMQEAKLEDMKAMLDSKDEQIKSAMKTVQQVQDMSLERSKELSNEREVLLQDLQRAKEDLVQGHRERDLLKRNLAELEVKGSGAEDALSKSKVEIETLQADLSDATSKLEKLSKEKSAATEKLAVLEAEYRTYKAVCNTPTKLADQLNKLVSLEADRASVQSRLFEAEEDAGSNRALVAQLKEQVKDLKQKLARADTTRRKLHNELQELKGNIRVFARVRPAEERCVLGIDDENGYISVPYNGAHNEFRLDRAFNPRSSQEDVFAEVSQFVQSALDGYNVSLFAYGQTGSGKTHTMFGSGQELGIIPRSIAQILECVEEQKENNWEYALEASFLEIYNEQVFDLLCPEAEREGRKYTIVQGENGRHDVTDLTWRSVRTQEDVEEMLESSQRNKHVARTDMNERSSRSHTVFSLRISAARSAAGGHVQTLYGTLHLVDLAGSERLAKSNATGDRLKETQSINKSLSAMSDVFVAISKHQPHVPYRNSKLTFLLQPCLSGDGKALMIANCSPIESSAHETLCTLRFASMVSSCELGKATKHISSDKTPNNSLASHASLHGSDSMYSMPDCDASLDSSISSICTTTSTTTARSTTAASRRLNSARGEPSDAVRPSTRRTPRDSTAAVGGLVRAASNGTRVTRGAASGDARAGKS